MRKTALLIVFIMMLGMISVSAENNVLQLFVSLEGSDANDGSISAPFASIEKAQETIRNLKEYPSGGVCVNFREGEYKITKTINFSSADSGKQNAPIVYRGYDNEKVVFSGMRNLCYKDWQPLTDAKVKNKLPKELVDKVVQMDLSKTDVDLGHLFHFGQDYTTEDSTWSELVFDGEVMDLARYPNDKKYLYVEEVLSNGVEPNVGSEWKTSDKILNTLTDEKDLWVNGWLIWHWTANFEKVGSVNPNDGVIKTAIPIKTHGTVRVAKDHPYYLVNAPSLIDVPNEYYIDRENKILYFYPPKDTKEIKVGLTELKQNMIKMNKTSFVTFQNMTFENGRSIGFETRDCNNIIIDSCTIQNFSYNAANFWGSKDCQVVNSHVYNIGSRAINVEGGNAETLTSCGFRLVNNEIHKLGRINKTQATAFWGHGYNGGTVGMYVANNKFYNMPVQIGGGGPNSIIEYNEVFDCSNESADMAAIYLGGNFLSGRGLKVRYNYIHDIPCNFKGETGYGTNGIYLDIDADGYEVYGNVVANVHRNMYYSSSGSYVKVYNNVFIGDKNAESIREFPTSAQTMRIAGLGGTETTADLKKRIKPYGYESELWQKSFPEIAISLKTDFPRRGAHKIYNNIMYNCMEMSITEEALQEKWTEIKNNWIKSTDPGFVDLKNKNYQLKSDAPVLKEIPDFQIIDMSKIGLLKEKVVVGTEIETPQNSPNTKDKVKNAVCLSVNSASALNNGEKVGLDGVSPVIVDSRTLVPVRFISECFGARVGWKEATKQIAVVLDGKTVIMQLDSNILNIDGKETEMDTTAKSINDRTFIPLRALCDAIGKKVFWDNKGLIVISKTDNILNSEADAALIDELLEMLK